LQQCLLIAACRSSSRRFRGESDGACYPTHTFITAASATQSASLENYAGGGVGASRSGLGSAMTCMATPPGRIRRTASQHRQTDEGPHGLMQHGQDRPRGQLRQPGNWDLDRGASLATHVAAFPRLTSRCTLSANALSRGGGHCAKKALAPLASRAYVS
jgi:hypothetical protein